MALLSYLAEFLKRPEVEIGIICLNFVAILVGAARNGGWGRKRWQTNVTLLYGDAALLMGPLSRRVEFVPFLILEFVLGIVGIFVLRTYYVAAKEKREDSQRWNAAYEFAIMLELPYEGVNNFVVAGEPKVTNSVAKERINTFAVSVIPFEGDAFGAPVFAPASGTVVHASHSAPDKANLRVATASRSRGEERLGNYVVTRVAGGGVDAYIFLSRLQRGSIAVVPGTNIAVGDFVGRCGSSGEKGLPYLQIHAQREPQYTQDATPVPFAFYNAPRTLQSGDLIGEPDRRLASIS